VQVSSFIVYKIQSFNSTKESQDQAMINIFLSWSGTTGELIATKLRLLLKTQLRGVKPFMSDVDILKGEVWKKILDESLMETGYAMFIITPDAMNSVWMGYEAGSIYTVIKNRENDVLPKNVIFPLLFKGQGDRPPSYLSDIQGIEFTKEKWQDIFYRIAKSSKEETSDDDFTENSYININDSFECFWQLFDQDVRSILKEAEEEKARNNLTSDVGSSNVKETIPSKLMEAILSMQVSMQGLNSSFDKILGIEKKLDDLSEQFGDFQSRLTPALTETGFLRTDAVNQSPSPYPSSRLSSSVKRFKDVYAYIQKNGLLDENTLQELGSILEELD